MVDFSGHLSPIALSANPRIVEAMTRVSDVRQALEQVSRAYEFQGFLVMVVPGKTCGSLSESVVMTNWPQDFIAAYDAAIKAHDGEGAADACRKHIERAAETAIAYLEQMPSPSRK